MKKEIFKTADGSITLHIPEWNEQYHSKHGAVQEAEYVFIKQGLDYLVNELKADSVELLEIGFGTGLNTLLSYKHAMDNKLPITYTGIEAYPLDLNLIEDLNFPKIIGIEKSYYLQLHKSPWEEWETLEADFKLLKKKMFFQDIKSKNEYNLIYFDAFGSRVQPELWEEEIFEIMYNSLKENGVLVTYAAKGSVRRAMEKLGFKVERLPGPPGKREMLRAIKLKY